MADIYTPSGLIRFKSAQPDLEPRKSTIIFLRQFARTYSPLLGGIILN